MMGIMESQRKLFDIVFQIRELGHVKSKIEDREAPSANSIDNLLLNAAEAELCELLNG